MRRHILVAVALAAMLAIAAATASARSAAPARAQADKVTVWLMGDAKSNWPEAVAAATAAFKQKHPGVDVDVQKKKRGEEKHCHGRVCVFSGARTLSATTSR